MVVSDRGDGSFIESFSMRFIRKDKDKINIQGGKV